MNLKYCLAFVYDSDDDVPIAAADPIYYFGLPIGKVAWVSPKKIAQAVTYWLADNANPAGLVTKKIPVHAQAFGCNALPVDAVPFYLALGKATADTPSTDQFTIQGNISGNPPALIFHEENNLLSNEQAKEYATCRCTKLECNVVDGALNTKLEFLAEREYDMTNDNVVQLDNDPVMRGKGLSVNSAASTRGPYKIRGNSGLSLTWNSKSLGKFVQEFSFSIENDVVGFLLADGNDYGVLFNRGKRTFSPVTFKFVVEPGGTNDLDDMEALVDNSTKSDLVLKIPRRHANDYLQFTFKNAYLQQWNILPAPMSSEDLPLIEGVWHGVTDIEVVDAQVTSAGAADPNDDEDYELA